MATYEKDLDPGSTQEERVDFFVADEDGYAKIVRGIAEEYLLSNYTQDNRLKLGETVKRIEYWPECACVNTTRTDGANAQYCAQEVITTFSLGTLQRGTVEFVPELPDWKGRAINLLFI